MSISDELQRILEAKASIISVIELNGVDVPTPILLGQLPPYIQAAINLAGSSSAPTPSSSSSSEVPSSSSYAPEYDLDYPASTKDGSKSNPLYWDDIIDTSYGNRKHTTTFITTGDTHGSRDVKCVYIYLSGGVTYHIYEHSDNDTYLYLLDSNGSQLDSNDDYDSWDSSEIDGISPGSNNSFLSYRPSSSGFYIIAAAMYSDTGSASLHVSPEPPSTMDGAGSSSSSGQEQSSSSSQSGGESHTYLYTVSGASIDGINGDYWLSSGTANTTNAVYTNGSYCLAYIDDYWVGWYICAAESIDEDPSTAYLAYNRDTSVTDDSWIDGITVVAYNGGGQQSSSSAEASSSSESQQGGGAVTFTTEKLISEESEETTSYVINFTPTGGTSYGMPIYSGTTDGRTWYLKCIEYDMDYGYPVYGWIITTMPDASDYYNSHWMTGEERSPFAVYNNMDFPVQPTGALEGFTGDGGILTVSGDVSSSSAEPESSSSAAPEPSSSSAEPEYDLDYPASTKDGSLDNPYYWDDIVDSTYSNRSHSTALDLPGPTDTKYQVNKNPIYAWVKLQRGVTYHVGVKGNNSDKYIMLVGGYAYNEVDRNYVDYEGNIDGVSFSDNNEDATQNVIPKMTAWYRFGGRFSSSSTIGNVTLHISPAPMDGTESAPSGIDTHSYYVDGFPSVGPTDYSYLNGVYFPVDVVNGKTAYQNEKGALMYYGSGQDDPGWFISDRLEELGGSWNYQYAGNYNETSTPPSEFNAGYEFKEEWSMDSWWEEHEMEAPTVSITCTQLDSEGGSVELSGISNPNLNGTWNEI